MALVNPSQEELLSNALKLVEEDKYPQAIKCFDIILSHNPSIVEAWKNKAISLCAQGKYDEALACLGQSLRHNPNNASLWYNKGVVFLKINECSEAINCFNRALCIDPNYKKAEAKKTETIQKQSSEEGIEASDKAILLYKNAARDMDILKQLSASKKKNREP